MEWVCWWKARWNEPNSISFSDLPNLLGCLNSREWRGFAPRSLLAVASDSLPENADIAQVGVLLRPPIGYESFLTPEIDFALLIPPSANLEPRL